MHRLDVILIEFDLLGLEVEIVRHYTADDVQVTIGRHEDHGLTVLIRTGETLTALVDEPAVFEMRRKRDAAKAAVPARATRAGKDC